MRARHELFMALVIIIPILLVLRRALGIHHDSFTACRVAWVPAFVQSWLRSLHRSVITQRLILVECRAHVHHRLAVPLHPEQFTKCSLPFLVISTKCQIERVRCQVRVGLSQGIIAITGPVVVDKDRRPWQYAPD